MICLVIVALIALPLFELLNTSKRMTVSGRERILAMNLASSYMAGLSAAEREALPEMDRAEDVTIAGPASLARLGVPQPPAGFRRTLSLQRLALDGPERPMTQAAITVEWESRATGATVSYTLLGLL
jgi:Tfp pilus assembly protein PilX